MQLLIFLFKFFIILIGIINFSTKSPAKPYLEKVKAITYFLSKENFKKEILDKLEQENSLLYIMSHYDERDFRKDFIKISMYYVDVKQIPSVGKTHQMIAVDSLRMLKKPDGFKNISYQSTYNIKKSELQELYKKFENDSELKYFVIKPDYYEQD